MSDEERKAAVKDFALTKGLLVALLAGVMSACFNLGLEAGAPMIEMVKAGGANDLFAMNPVVALVTFGGFLTNSIYCLYQNKKNKTFSDYGQKKVLVNNLLFCALAGILWYSQFFGGRQSCYARFLVEHPHVVERDFQQCVGHCVERMERRGSHEHYRFGYWLADPYFLAGFPKYRIVFGVFLLK